MVSLAGANVTDVDVYGVNLKWAAGLEAVRGWDTSRNKDKVVF